MDVSFENKWLCAGSWPVKRFSMLTMPRLPLGTCMYCSLGKSARYGTDSCASKNNIDSKKVSNVEALESKHRGVTTAAISAQQKPLDISAPTRNGCRISNDFHSHCHGLCGVYLWWKCSFDSNMDRIISWSSFLRIEYHDAECQGAYGEPVDLVI